MDARLFTGSVGYHVKGFDAGVTIHPDYAVVGKAKFLLLIEVNDGSDTCGESKNSEDRGGQLELEFLKLGGRRSCSETITLASESTFDAALNFEFYIENSQFFYNLQAAAAERYRFWEKYTMRKCIEPTREFEKRPPCGPEYCPMGSPLSRVL
jgi:hypothetical protein